jgi:hypothetical protein
MDLRMDNVQAEDESSVVAALSLAAHGIEFSDAIHLTSRPPGARLSLLTAPSFAGPRVPVRCCHRLGSRKVTPDADLTNDLERGCIWNEWASHKDEVTPAAIQSRAQSIGFSNEDRISARSQVPKTNPRNC